MSHAHVIILIVSAIARGASASLQGAGRVTEDWVGWWGPYWRAIHITLLPSTAVWCLPIQAGTAAMLKPLMMVSRGTRQNSNTESWRVCTGGREGSAGSIA